MATASSWDIMQECLSSSDILHFVSAVFFLQTEQILFDLVCLFLFRMLIKLQIL